MIDSRDDDPGGSLLVVGYVAGAHGVRGAVRVHLHDPRSPSLEPGRRVVLRHGGRTIGTHEVGRVDPVPGKPGRMRVTLLGVPGRTEAEALRGCELLVDRGELPELADDEFYLADAIGLPVARQHDERALGTIVGLTSNGAQDLFEVEYRGADGRARTWLLPVLPDFLVEMTDARVLVDLPQGLLPEDLEPVEPEPEPEPEPDAEPDSEP
jgi:16S rRNA processing protein RimM